MQISCEFFKINEKFCCLFHKVLMKDIVTPVPQEDVKAVIRKCLEQAAQVNYQRLSEYAKLEGTVVLCQYLCL